jgi:hypothetical protein
VAWKIIVGILIALVAMRVALVTFLIIARLRGSTFDDPVRIVPDDVRLLPRLAADPAVAEGARVRLWCCSPIWRSRLTWCMTSCLSSVVPTM